MTPTIRPGPLRSNSRSVISPHARGQKASLAARKRGGRSEQAQQGWQRLGDLNIDLMGAALTRPTGIGSELQIADLTLTRF